MQADWEIAVFDRFTLDTRRRVLLAAGQPVQLDAKAFDLLAYLISRRAAPVSVTEALAEVWPGRTVSAANVAVQLSELRAALKKAGAADRLIVTSPGPRYRFVGDVAFPECRPAPPPEAATAPKQDPEGEPEPAPPARARRRLGVVMIGPAILLAVLVAGLAVVHPSWLDPDPASTRLKIAVRPFRFNSGNLHTDILADEITDDLRDDLAHIPQSIVIDRESVEHFKKDTPDQLARDLHVRYIVEGRVAPEDSRYHVNASLIDTATSAQAWSRTYDPQGDRISEVREKLVREIARQLHLQIDQLESSRSLHDRPNNPDAMDNFRIARARLDIDDSPEAFRAAQALLEKAIAQQPKFGDALAELGWVLLRKNQSFDDQAEGDRDWVEAADVIGRVLELAPQNSLARTVRARQLFMENNIHDAAMAAKIAVQIEPSNVDAHWVLADCAWGLGQLDQEEAELAMVGELNPDGLLNKQRLLMLGAIELLKNHPKDAIELLTQSISGDPEPVPGDGQGGRAQYARLLLIAAYSLAEQPQEAKERYRTYNQKWPNRSVWRFEATLPRAIDAMPNAQAMLSALQSAGMPRYADGSDSVMPPGVDCAGDDYSKTPLGLPNGRVLETADVDRALAASIKPLVVDVSLFGSGALQDALWYDPAGPAETSTEFVERVVSNLRASDQTRPVIVMGDGPFGCAAYNAAVNLIEKKYQNVQWYRGGEEAWVASGHKFQDHRPE